MQVQMLQRPLTRTLPLLGLSASGLILATSYLSPSKPSSLAKMSTSASPWPVKQYTPRHTSWPYNPSDFTRQDSSPDPSFYSSPRFVTHIDDAAITSLREYYDSVLPRKGKILDFCSSWISHYPPAIEEAARKGDVEVVGMGMNKAELDRNAVLKERILKDLNVEPEIDVKGLDASTCVVSIDYLTNPVSVLRSLRKSTNEGGSVHLIISNRCFPTKAISRWLRVEEEERLEMVGDYLHFAGGWTEIEIVELSDGTVKGGEGLLAKLGMARRDPLWVVRAKAG